MARHSSYSMFYGVYTLMHDQIYNFPKDRSVIYMWEVVNHPSQNPIQNKVTLQQEEILLSARGNSRPTLHPKFYGQSI